MRILHGTTHDHAEPLLAVARLLLRVTQSYLRWLRKRGTYGGAVDMARSEVLSARWWLDDLTDAEYLAAGPYRDERRG